MEDERNYSYEREDDMFPARGSRKIRGAAYDVSEENQNAILNFPFARYACFSEEICPTTGRPHLQFYIWCTNAVRKSTLRQHIKEARFMHCTANHEANILYVLKQRDKDYRENADNPDFDGNAATFKENGERPDERQQAARTLDALTECQNFFIATNHAMPDHMRTAYFDRISEVTDSLCFLLDMTDFHESDSETECDDDKHMCSPPPKKRKY